MWSDNESSLDLLGFTPYAETVADLVRNEALLPLTVGIFGDWGSGKSSLMMQVEKAVAAEDVAIVKFQPWLHKDYDDVKSALMVAILDALEARKGVLAKAGDAAVQAATKGLQKLGKRIDWLRAIGYIGRAGVGVVSTLAGNPLGALGVIGAVSDAGEALAKGEFLKEEDAAKFEVTEPVERGITEFRRDFSGLIDVLKIKALVVMVDDIDRCLPTTIIDVLEAIRLFFAVPKTAFVVGADERIIRHALSTKYPEAPELKVDLGREYLEKIIQVPVSVPKLTSSDVQGYLHLLVLQLHLAHDEAVFKSICEKAGSCRAKNGAAVEMNYGIAKEFIKGEAPDLNHDLAAISEIASILGPFLNGRPRQAKRFLNTLYLRRALANKIGVKFDFAVLAKLTIVEYFDLDLYRKLYETRSNDGIVADIGEIEEFAKSGKGEYKGSLATYLGRERVKRWFAAEPSLSKVDLTPYFALATERLVFTSSGGQRLSENLQNIVSKLLSESEAARSAAVDDAKHLEEHDVGAVFAALADMVRQNPTEQHVLGLVEIAGVSNTLAGDLASVLIDVPVDRIAMTIPGRIQVTTFKGSQPSGALATLLEKWATQETHKRLAIAAKTALQSGGKK